MYRVLCCSFRKSREIAWDSPLERCLIYQSQCSRKPPLAYRQDSKERLLKAKLGIEKKAAVDPNKSSWSDSWCLSFARCVRASLPQQSNKMYKLTLDYLGALLLCASSSTKWSYKKNAYWLSFVRPDQKNMWLEVMPYGQSAPRAKYFPSRPSRSLIKYIKCGWLQGLRWRLQILAQWEWIRPVYWSPGKGYPLVNDGAWYRNTE